MDQAPKWLARLETSLITPVFYPLISGKGGRMIKRIFENKMNNGNDSSDYIQKFMKMMGAGGEIDFSFILKRIYEKSVLYRSIHQSR